MAAGKRIIIARALAAALGLLLLIFVASLELRTPAPAGTDAPPGDFSAARAAAYLPGIASEPHPAGSAADAEVRSYLVRTLESLGLQAELQQGTVDLEGRFSRYQGGSVTLVNILARLPGTAGGGRAVLIMCHYDSVPAGPGASDDGAAVAAVLETIRALEAGPPLRNDIIFLLTDGEELGLLGARLFAEGHPWRDEIGVILNFEARGNGGPSIMFETSGDNAWLIKELASDAPYPVASSLSDEIYEMMPNLTDLTVFKPDFPGLNFAFIHGGFTHYHTAADTIGAMDPGSLQHHGSYMLSLARGFGNSDLSGEEKGNAIFFNPLPRLLVSYPQSWAIPLAALALLFFIAVVIQGFRRKRLTPGGLALGAALFPAAALLALVMLAAGWLILDAIFMARRVNQGAVGDLCLAGFIALSAAAVMPIQTRLRGRIGMQNLLLGNFLWWTAAAAATAVFFPGASYLFVWPLLGGLAGAAIVTSRREPEEFSWGHLSLVFLCSAPAVLIFLLFIGLSADSFPFPISGILIVPVVLLLGLLSPLIETMAAPKKWLPAVLAAGLGLICLTWAVVL